jgi:hypothetical protein
MKFSLIMALTCATDFEALDDPTILKLLSKQMN